jgi:iron complex outermembrane receptor protein
LKNNKIALAVLMAFANSAGAEELINLNAIEVTARPIIEEIGVDAYSSTSAVVTENQLRDQNAVDLASALRRTPGVQISRYNPVGAFGGDQGGAVYIRGMGVSRPGSEIKTYVDDVPFYMGVWGHPLLDLLPVNGMQSITVYKSPQPQINGNNFASINLETKRATEDGIHGDARLSGGSFGTVVEQANLVGRTGAIDFMLAQGYAKSNGDRKDSDGELQNVMGRIGAQFNEHWRADVSVLYVDNKASDPQDARNAIDPITPEYKSQATMLTASISHKYDNLSGSFKVYSNRGEGNLYNDNRNPGGWGTFLTDFDMSGMRLKEDFSPWVGGSVLAGLDVDHISGKVQGPFTGDVPPFFIGPGIPFTGNHVINMPDFRITSPYIALNQAINISDHWSLVPSAGIRFYNHSEYESKSAPHAGVSLISDKATIFANLSRGINYPGLEGPAMEAALPFLFPISSWKKLSPEELNHVEIGLKLSPTQGTQVDVSLFSDKIKNRYIYDFSAGPTTFQNSGGYHTNGAELSVKQDIGANWVVFGGLTLLNPSISGLPYTPKSAFTAGLNGQVGPIKLALDALYQSQVRALSRNRDVSQNPNTEKVASFTLVNARASYPLTALGKKGEVFLAVENLFDRDYEYRPGYAMPGVSGQLGFSASF